MCLKELLQEPLFNNDTFQIGESHICNKYHDWKQAGIELVYDIMNSDGIFFSRTEIENKFRIRISYLKYYQIVNSIKSVLTKTPKTISRSIEKDNKIQNLCLRNVQKVTSQQVYCQLVKKLY